MLRFLRSLLILCAAVLMPAAAASAQSPEADVSVPYRDYALGAEDAPIELIEYASFSCPHCGHFHEQVWPVIQTEFVETGQLRFIFRPIVTQPVQIAAASAILATCAGEERYFDAVDLLFFEQDNVFSTIREQGDVLAIYNRIAGAVGLTPEDFETCLQTPEYTDRVTQTIEMANADGISGTPNFLIQGRLLKVEMVDGTLTPTLDGMPVIINGERLSGDLDADNFRRIVLHFLNESDSDN
ncbi:MAG: thioredoxin domain-containing protein [Alphaproteobacteria bacterium]|nr:thioredoxin domain-containing protein [Alphaproteobacteria bacterium]